MAKGKKTGGKNWKPGQSGNPAGREKKGATLTDLLKEYGETQSRCRERGSEKAFFKKLNEIQG